MARQEVSRTTHIEEGELRVTHENAILTNITPTIMTLPNEFRLHTIREQQLKSRYLKTAAIAFWQKYTD